MDNQKTIPNRLASERSPYLLQHAENPVDWHPWGEEAFNKAEKEDKPIFLSIGYSTCHWCHVMAHESFEDQEVADILNQDFVSIKVDREERPDIDSVYMTACQAMTGAGGWPLTIIMTPEKKPFFAGTYFPKRGRHGTVGLIELLEFISEKWESNREDLLAESEKITDFIKSREKEEAQGSASSGELIEGAEKYFRRAFDDKWGGFGPEPKFPSPHNLLFLIAREENGCLPMAEKTLVQMYRGGIFDHIGGGFCRYSTDARWLAPHFEKMLYDNAFLMLAYSEAYKKTRKELYAAIVEKIFFYIMRELTDEDGAFYCSQDADSDGEEGKFYTFAPGEILEILGEEDGHAFCARFDITARGNFEGKSIPNRIEDAYYEQMPNSDQLEKLRHYRKERNALHRDDKILTAWNGATIAALARCAAVLERPDYLKAAAKAADFVWEHLQRDGSLQVRWRCGQAAHPGTLEDYAFFIWGLLECYRSSFDAHYLEKAILAGEHMLDQFFDHEKGGCYLYGRDSEQLFVRPKEAYDGAMPSGNSVAALALKRLAFYTGEGSWRAAWEKQEGFMKKKASPHPAAHGFFLWLLAREEKSEGQLICVCAGPVPLERLRKLEMEVLVKTRENEKRLEKIAPFLRDYPIPQSGADYYHCQGRSCSKPVHID